mgnify:CR=1 FL=1
MTMFGSQWLANAGASYEIEQSIRFNDNDTAYLTRTPVSASNRKTWTISTWVKYSIDTSSGSAIFGSGATAAEDTFAYITSGGAIDWIVRDSSTIRGRIITNRLFRDPSAWYHLIFVLDTTSGTAGNRMRLYVNGSEETSFATDTNPPVNTDSTINSTLAQYIGLSRGNGGDNLWDGYQAEINFVDGTALAPTAFGETNDDGVWIPVSYSGSYGTNGYYLTGADSTALGEDVRISGDQVISYAASQYTGATGSYTYSNGRLEADSANKAIKTADTFAGDFEFSWNYVAMANLVIGVYETGEDGTFSDSSSAGNMQNMTDSWYIQTSSVAANRDIFYGGAVQVNATTIANGDTWKMTRSSGTIKLIRNGSDVHTFSQTSTNTVRIVVAQGDAAADLSEVVWVDNSTLGNNFFSSGLAAVDQMSDSPTANHCTLNPLWVDGHTLSDGNLVASAAANSAAIGTMAFDVTDSAGFYFEAKVTTAATYPNVGIRTIASPSQVGAVTSLSGNSTGRYAFTGSNGEFNDAGSGSSYGSAWAGTADKVIGVLVKDGALYFSIDGTIQNSGTAAKTGLTGLMLPTVFYDAGSGTAAAWELRFDASDWGTTPSGYKAITTANLATPTIADGSKYFQPTLYEGDGSTQSIDQSGNSTFQPDWVWIKNRDAADAHALFDAVRGATKVISSVNADAEDTNADTLTAFESDGFALGDDVIVNTNAESYVAWQWKANGSGSSNEDGSVNTTATSVNTTAGFSISKWTHTTSANYTVGHGLGAVPKMVIVKTLDQGTNWGVYHSALTVGKRLLLNGTGAEITGYWGANTWNSTVFSIGSERDANGSTMVGYAFAEVEGYSSIGSYEGNGSADGTFVYTGFRPSFLLVKNIDAVESWQIRDSKRDPFNVSKEILFPDTSGAEATSGGGQFGDLLSNGFKWRGADGGNNSAATFMYMAFAENPFGGDGVAPATAR